MATAALNTAVPNWYSCKHQFECHKLKSSYLHPFILPVSTAGGAWGAHAKRHKCSANAQCVSGVEKANTTRAEFFRAAGLLALKHKGDQREKLVKLFGKHWRLVYPDITTPIDDDGLPVDLSNDPRFKPGNEGNPQPNVPAPTEVHQQPIASGSDIRELDENDETPPDPAASLFTPPCPASLDLPPDLPPISHDSPPISKPEQRTTSHSSTANSSTSRSQTTLNGDAMIKYLQQHEFGIAIRPSHSGIEGGLFPNCKPEKKAHRVVFVENPEIRIPDSLYPLSFLTETSIDKRVYDRLKKGMPECVKEIPKKGKKKRVEGPEKIECYISSWLLLAVEMLDKPSLWKVTFTSWPDFLETVSTRDGPAWALLMRETDLIIGGLDFESDFLNPNAAFGVDGARALEYMKGMSVLSHVAMWPSPAESLLAAQKAETNHILVCCASALGLSHPLIAPVGDGKLEAVAASITSGKCQGVLKREFSGFSRHVITPHFSLADAMRIINNYRVEAATYWNDSSSVFPRPLWYLQPYLAHLMHLGEVRAFFVNGAYYYSVATTPENFDPTKTINTSATYKRPLSTFTYDPDNPTDPSSVGWLTLDGDHPPPNPSLFNNNESFEMFSLNMLGKLILAEERASNALSALRIFARLDISVYRDASVNGSGFQYVVSEVNRTLGTCLYSAFAEPIGTWDALVTHLAETLHLVTSNKCLVKPAPTPPGL